MNIAEGQIKIVVEKVRVSGSGAIILTGPSSCGKGEIAKELRRILSIPYERHLSMGEILRDTIRRAHNDETFRSKLSTVYSIRDDKAVSAQYLDENLCRYYGGKPLISEFDYLEYCVFRGLLVPDAWTINIVDAILTERKDLRENIFIIDGYPRTVKAAEELLKSFEKLSIPIIKVIHLSITKAQMLSRALGRNRIDDNVETLERRYQFYIEQVQPSIDYLKNELKSGSVALIDAHQPVFVNGQIDVRLSIKQVALSVLMSLGIPNYMLDI